jgi:hypothetical protein
MNNMNFRQFFEAGRDEYEKIRKEISNKREDDKEKIDKKQAAAADVAGKEKETLYKHENRLPDSISLLQWVRLDNPEIIRDKTFRDLWNELAFKTKNANKPAPKSFWNKDINKIGHMEPYQKKYDPEAVEFVKSKDDLTERIMEYFRTYITPLIEQIGYNKVILEKANLFRQLLIYMKAVEGYDLTGKLQKAMMNWSKNDNRVDSMRTNAVGKDFVKNYNKPDRKHNKASQIEQLIKSGWTDLAIEKELAVSKRMVAAARKNLGIPQPKGEKIQPDAQEPKFKNIADWEKSREDQGPKTYSRGWGKRVGHDIEYPVPNEVEPWKGPGFTDNRNDDAKWKEFLAYLKQETANGTKPLNMARTTAALAIATEIGITQAQAKKFINRAETEGWKIRVPSRNSNSIPNPQTQVRKT